MGIVGGPLLSVADLCHQATAAALRMLGGEDPKNIGTVVVGSTPPVFDAREIERWKISEANLPPGSEVLFRPVTMWQQYRAQLLVIIAIVLLQSALITALLIERRRRRLAELESRDRVLEVAHLNRTATAGAMAGAIAHELNQPLGAILSNTETAELLLEAAEIDHTQIKEILGDIRRDDRRAVEIIKGVRGLMKKRGAAELDVHEIDVNDAISEAAHILGPTAKSRGITLDLQQSRRSLPVRADRVHVQQVVLNLVLNGMDAMLGRADAHNIIVVGTTIVGNSEAMVSVADRGTGIPSDKLVNIFDPFYTTKPQGTGLGLSIAKSIVEMYGGKIWAENGSEGGSIFCFTLPLAMAEAR
jgi:signal transduction histidine kinase